MSTEAKPFFSGSRAYLSNFFKSNVKYDGVVYPTVEHAFQAAKSLDPKDRMAIRSNDSPMVAKRMGRKVKLREGWNDMRNEIMKDLVRQKFENYPELMNRLVKEKNIVEYNRHHDNYWGHCICSKCASKPKQDHLGATLRSVKEEYLKEKTKR